ncbi:MAG: DUF4838 domain-containing protein, partial [Clostridia bacterium]|nr:DUF4838 domain-containing protein [Clostridia bacterium]
AMSEDNFSLSQSFKNEETFTLGDVNGDGAVNSRDSYGIKAYVAGISNEEIIADAADFSADGTVNSRDNFYLKACLSGNSSLSDFESSNQVYSFKIGGVDISKFVIVLPEGTAFDDNLYYCYELLWKYVEKATGVKIPLAYGETDSANAIYFHELPLDSEIGERLGYDGYIYRVENGNLHFYGAKRGNMYAVYEILEDYLGFFFCDNSFTYTEKKRSVDIAEGTDREYVAPIKFRHVLHTFWGSSFRNYYIARRLNSTTNSPDSGTETYGTYKGTRLRNAHSFYFYLGMGAGVMPEEGTLNENGEVMSLADRYYAKYLDGKANGYIYDIVNNPDKLNENGAQPCASSTSEYEVLFSGLLDSIRMIEARGWDVFLNEGQHVMSFSINDGNKYCICSMCAAKANGTKLTLRSSYKKELAYYGGEYELSEDGKSATFKKEGYAGVYLDLANRAAKDIQQYYPGAHLFQIIYNPQVPETVRPCEFMTMCYCASITGCSYHRYGDNADCVGYKTPWETIHTTTEDEQAILKWIEYCHESGCELWYWMYPENYTYYLFDLPVYYTIYYNITWLYEHGIDGIYYEGTQDSGAENCFEHVKAFMAAELEWNPAMTLEEYENLTKKYMKAYYGDGYEHVFRYLQYLEDAARATNFCYTYYCCAFDAYDKAYIDEHYEEMRAEAVKAVEMSDTGTRGLCEKLLMNCELLGLSAAHDRMYTNGDDASRKVYEERYTWLYNFLKDNISKYTYSANAAYCGLPASIDFTVSPLIQIYRYEYRNGAH